MTNGRLITGCLILLLATAPVTAAPFHHHRTQVAQHDQAGNGGNGGISLDEAVSRARQQNNGKVLSADTVNVNGRKVYQIKILTKDGRVKRTRVDAGSGRPQSRGR